MTASPSPEECSAFIKAEFDKHNQLWKRLGLTPKAMRLMLWSIVEDENSDSPNFVKVERSTDDAFTIVFEANHQSRIVHMNAPPPALTGLAM